MNFDLDDQCSTRYGTSSGIYGSYEASVASSASSTQASVFSDALSAQSSIASSISDDFRGSQEDARERDRICAQVQLRAQAQNNGLQSEEPSVLQKFYRTRGECPSYADVTSVPPQQRQHPRRCSPSRAQKPPPLTRQRDRKINFVDNLVGKHYDLSIYQQQKICAKELLPDSATQMVEVIWPLSVVPCKSEGSGRGVLPLRTYIEETLRRSRTSYSTLQVALYYLILIRPFVPKNDFTMEQSIDCPAERALMCGRRMFLAALILASKYLQDRNYSAKAWSRMSGLRVCEINTNERTFLGKINWKLHISKPTFEKWQEVVLRFTPNPPSPPGHGVPLTSAWKRLIPLLTPELDTVPSSETYVKPAEEQSSDMFGLASPNTPTPTKSALESVRLESTSQESTPTPMTVLPRFLEPKPDIQPPTPALARMGPLPTPNMTPSSVASNTPAASVYGSRRPSICSAWALAQKTSLNRCVFDPMDSRPPLSRRPSVMSVMSSGSSPESLMSDHSRSSRSSSVSSVSTVSTTSSLAPQRACLARQATCRNAGLPPLKLVKEEKEGSASQPILIDDDSEMVSSPLAIDFTVSEKALHAPHRHSRTSKHAPLPSVHCSLEKGKKRGRSSGHHRRSELQEEVRYLLEESLDDVDDDDVMEVDDHSASPSHAAEYAGEMLIHRCNSRSTITTISSPSTANETQLSTMTYSRATPDRVAVQKNDGRKRTCCSAGAITSIPLYGEVA